MPKSIWFPDDEFEQLVALARQAGFRVSRGRGSQLRLFVMMAANTACTQTAGTVPPETNPVKSEHPSDENVPS